jgi:hypothetical protein
MAEDLFRLNQRRLRCGLYKVNSMYETYVPKPVKEEELACNAEVESPSMAPSSSENPTSTTSAPDSPMFPSSQVNTSSNSAAFFLAPSLIQAMQRMPGTFPDSAFTSDSTQEPFFLDDDRTNHSDQPMQNKEVVEDSGADTSSTTISRHENSFCGLKQLQETHDKCIKSSKQLYKEQQKQEGAVGNKPGIRLQRNDPIERLSRGLDDLSASMKQVLEKKYRERGATRESNTESYENSRNELAEVQEKLRQKSIYARSLVKYVDELETKIDLLTHPDTVPPANQAQAGTQTDFATTPDPVQQNNHQEETTTPGAAVHRWQVYRIKLLEKARDNLMELNQDLREKEAKAFKDAIHFERKLHDNARLMKRHMEICHESNAFLNMDIAEFKMNLDRIRAICDEMGEDYSYGFPNSSSIAAVGPDSTLGYAFIGRTDARNGQTPAFGGEEDAEEEDAEEEDAEEEDAEEEDAEEEMSREKSRSSACDSDWSNISVPTGSGSEIDGR